MPSPIRRTAHTSSYRSTLRMESLERRCVLSANFGLAGAPISGAASQMVVADFTPVVSDTTTSAPSESAANSTVELPTTKVRMPVSNLPEGIIQRFDRPFPPINVVTEEPVRMPESSNIPEGPIQRFARPFPPINEASLNAGVAPVIGPRLVPRTQVVLTELPQLKNLRSPLVLHAPNVESVAVLQVRALTTAQVEVTQIERAAALANSGRKISSVPPAESMRVAAAFDNALAELASHSLKMFGLRGICAF
jgi:hypothetical protein